MRNLIPLALLAALATLSAPSHAQTLLGLDGGGGGVFEFTGPPAGLCGYPAGPVIGGFPYMTGTICPTSPGPIVPPPPFGILGGLTHDVLTDTTWVTDGFAIGGYTPAGVLFNGWPAAALPGPLTGMTVDPVTGILFVTDGFFVAGLLPPPAPGCGPAFVVIPPWPAAGAIGGPFTGLTWDPAAGMLWAVDVTGMVSMIPIGGLAAPAFPVIPDFVCGALGGFGPPQGIAIDTATAAGAAGTPPSFYVTDGVMVVYVMLGGPPGVPTFYTPFPCIPVPAGPISGLAYTSHAISYGVGSDPAGLLPPVIGSTGDFVSPSGPITITLTGADPTPGTLAALYFSIAAPFGTGGAACPPIPFGGGNTLLLAPTPLFGPLGPFPTAAGALTLPAALPPALPPLSIMFQWLIAKGSGGIQTSDGLEFTVGMP